MAQDIEWKGYLADNDRYADIINGVVCGGKQIITGGDLYELDAQGKNKARDILRKAAFGVNFAIIGIENQEIIDYSMPLRNMLYDAGEYEKQVAKIRKKVRKKNVGLKSGEYLYGFKKESRINPVVTFVLYSGEEEWDGAESLHDMIDFTDVPESIAEMVQDYRINLVEIRKIKDIGVFKTDVRQVFDFIRCSDDKEALKKLVECDNYYKNMNEDAYDIVAHYTKASELIEVKGYYCGKDGKVDMCKALKELIEDGREEGRIAGRTAGRIAGLSEGREVGLRALVVSLSLLLPDSDTVYQAVINNEDYSNVSKEQVMKYYKR